MVAVGRLVLDLTAGVTGWPLALRVAAALVLPLSAVHLSRLAARVERSLYGNRRIAASARGDG